MMSLCGGGDLFSTDTAARGRTAQVRDRSVMSSASSERLISASFSTTQVFAAASCHLGYQWRLVAVETDSGKPSDVCYFATMETPSISKQRKDVVWSERVEEHALFNTEMDGDITRSRRVGRGAGVKGAQWR